MLSLFVAVAENGVIGKQGELLPWKLSADLKRFKQLTMGHPVIMGRKTYETIGRPLPGRLNIVITRSPKYSAEGCTVVQSIEAAVTTARHAEGSSEVFIIGGNEIYKATEPQADKLYLTRVHAKPEGDTYFTYDSSRWQQIERQDFAADSENQYPYSFITYVRK